MRGIGLLWWILLARRQARLAHVGPQLLDAAQLHADPALAFGKIRCALAVLSARPERHAVGFAQDADNVVPGAALLALVGDALGDRLDGVDVGVADRRQQPGGGGLLLRFTPPPWRNTHLPGGPIKSAIRPLTKRQRPAGLCCQASPPPH